MKEQYMNNAEIRTAYESAKAKFDAIIKSAEPSDAMFEEFADTVKRVNKLCAMLYYSDKALNNVTLDTFPKVTARFTAKGAKENSFECVNVPANVYEWAKMTDNKPAVKMFHSIRALCCLIDYDAKSKDIDNAKDRAKILSAVNDDTATRPFFEKGQKMTKNALYNLLEDMADGHALGNKPVNADASHLLGYTRQTRIQNGAFVDKYLSMAEFSKSLTQTIHRIVTHGFYADYAKPTKE